MVDYKSYASKGAAAKLSYCSAFASAYAAVAVVVYGLEVPPFQEILPSSIHFADFQ